MKDLIERLKKALGYKSDAELSRRLGLSPQNFLSRKKSGGIKDILILHAIENGIDKDWLLTGIGEMKGKRSIQEDSATARDLLALTNQIVELHRLINNLGQEIGRMRDKQEEAAQTGDIKRLGILGGKGH